MTSRRRFLAAGAAVVLSGCAVTTQETPSPKPRSTQPSGQVTPGTAWASPTSGPSTPKQTPTPVEQTATPAQSASPSASATPQLPAELQGLAPLLAQRFMAAQKGAAAAGLTLTLTSGYRTQQFQQELFDQRVQELGSVAAAEQFVLPPDKSEHCKGMAIDVGPTVTEMSWLEAHQHDYGLCRRYENEPWHFELSNANGTCPPMLPNAADAWK